MSATVQTRIDSLCDTIEELTDSISLEDVNRCLLAIVSCQSELCYLPRDLVEEYRARLVRARTKLITLGRIVGNKIPAVPTIDPSKLVVTDHQIGHGSFGLVYAGRLAGTPVAVKKIKKVSDSTRKMFMDEASFMSKINNENVVRFLGTTVGEDDFMIISELCDCDLKSVSCDGRGKDPQAFVKNAVRWLCQAARGLVWMHDICYMVHRDLKPANILLKDGHALLTDFGFTDPMKDKDEEHFIGHGSPFYKAPEVIRNQPSSFPVDVYSLGISIFEVLVGDDPYLGFTHRNPFYEAVLKGLRPDLSRLKGIPCPESLKHLMVQCWDEDPDKRPKMKEVYERLKEIYIETIVPRGSYAFNFWLNNFGDEVNDHVSYNKFKAAMFGSSDMEQESEKWRLKLLGIPDEVPVDHVVRLEDLYYFQCWFGDWSNPADHVHPIVSIPATMPSWFVGYMSREAADAAVYRQYCNDTREVKQGCFLVRCSKTTNRETNPEKSPFTLTVCDCLGRVHSLRIVRYTTDGSLSCPNLGRKEDPVIRAKDLFSLIEALRREDILIGDPYVHVGIVQY